MGGEGVVEKGKDSQFWGVGELSPLFNTILFFAFSVFFFVCVCVHVFFFFFFHFE